MITNDSFPQQNQEVKKSLSLFDATMIVVGSMVGTGIFIVGTEMMQLVGSSGWYAIGWVLTGILTIIGALSYTELSAMYPTLGGQYSYLQKAYNSLVSFLFGWSTLLVIQTGTIAAVAVGFAKFFAYLMPVFGEKTIFFYVGEIPISATKLLAAFSILSLTYINSCGIELGKIIQNSMTVIKIGSLVCILILGFFMAFNTHIWNANWQNAFDIQQFNLEAQSWSSPDLFTMIGLVISSFVGALFASIAWENVTFISSEVKNPQRDVAISLFLGTLIVTILFVSINVMYLGILSKDEIVNAQEGRIGIAIAFKIFGTVASVVISGMVIISALGCNNGLILSGARVYYSMSRDNLFPRHFGLLNKHRVPGSALWLQGLWACLLCLSGSYSALLGYTISVVLIFYILSVLGVFILRHKAPLLPRPYKAFGYPILPFIYIVLASIICIGLFVYNANNLIGLIFVFSGVPAYFYFKKRT